MHVSSLLRRTLGLKGHKVKKVKEEGEAITAQLVPRKNSKPVCSGCGKRRPGYDTLPERTWRHVPLWGIPVVLTCRPRRVECPECGIVVEEMSWSAGKSTLSVPLIVVLSSYAKLLAWQEVARLFSVSWNTVAAAVASAVEYGLEHRDTYIPHPPSRFLKHFPIRQVNAYVSCLHGGVWPARSPALSTLR